VRVEEAFTIIVTSLESGGGFRSRLFLNSNTIKMVFFLNSNTLTTVFFLNSNTSKNNGILSQF
jgi:hypothetical protein